MRKLAFRLRDTAPLNFWLDQTLVELDEWLNIIANESKKT